MRDQDISAELREGVQAALQNNTPLNLQGSGSKGVLGRPAQGQDFPVAGHQGLVSYEPAELVLSARAGTPLREVETVLAENGQYLPFEPPHLGPAATLGGTLACGLSGPARFASGAARDHVLGVTMINGRGEIVRFGGQVMKNVAGYDMSRLMIGAYGTLGLLLEVSLKVLPAPECTQSRVLRMGSQDAIALMSKLGRSPLPLNGAAWDAGHLYLRFSGAAAAVNAATAKVGGDDLAQASGWWRSLRERELPFFQTERRLWRLSLPPASGPFPVAGECLLDWGGAQRWLKSHAPVEQVQQAAMAAGGHATLYRDPQCAGQVLSPLAPGVAALHRQLKQALDPQGIFNPGRMYAEI